MKCPHHNFRLSLKLEAVRVLSHVNGTNSDRTDMPVKGKSGTFVCLDCSFIWQGALRSAPAVVDQALEHAGIARRLVEL